ncbi:MAG: segregation/condensation protein A [Alphaproteobacteria bacterium]|nr:segregation/condensation protein A [Alphaproteobacteria bacterium]MBF0251481.1 segregation/condensation protein A [Alphaproteobacteria bacterium]
MGDDVTRGDDFDGGAGLPEMPSISPFEVDLDGYAGPIDVLLSLARDQKVDLIHISIVQLADQYLEFVQEARRKNLELAADYLVMAAWLAYLKSRLLIPELKSEDEPTGEELAAALQFQLQRLEAMQNAGERLMARARLGQDFYSRGAKERFRTTQRTIFDATLTDLIQAYAHQKSRGNKVKTLNIEQSVELMAIEDALARLRVVVGHTPDWRTLTSFLPQNLRSPLTRRSVMASTFGAVLQLAKEGRVKIRQDGTYGEIYFQTTDDWDKPFAHDRKRDKQDDEHDDIGPEDA